MRSIRAGTGRVGAGRIRRATRIGLCWKAGRPSRRSGRPGSPVYAHFPGTDDPSQNHESRATHELATPAGPGHAHAGRGPDRPGRRGRAGSAASGEARTEPGRDPRPGETEAIRPSDGAARGVPPLAPHRRARAPADGAARDRAARAEAGAGDRAPGRRPAPEPAGGRAGPLLRGQGALPGGPLRPGRVGLDPGALARPDRARGRLGTDRPARQGGSGARSTPVGHAALRERARPARPRPHPAGYDPAGYRHGLHPARR